MPGTLKGPGAAPEEGRVGDAGAGGLFKKKKKQNGKSELRRWKDGREYKMLLKEIEIRAIRWCRLAVCVKTHPALAPGLRRAHVKSKSKWSVRRTACTPAGSSGASDAPITRHQKKKKCCYFKAEPPSPPLPLLQSLVGHILDSWVNLPSVVYPSKSRWCFMRGFLQWKLQGYWCSTGLGPFLVWETHCLRQDHGTEAHVSSLALQCTTVKT